MDISTEEVVVQSQVSPVLKPTERFEDVGIVPAEAVVKSEPDEAGTTAARVSPFQEALAALAKVVPLKIPVIKTEPSPKANVVSLLMLRPCTAAYRSVS